jgi:predicted  nucleic acid-binding Zn-ribbon protein
MKLGHVALSLTLSLACVSTAQETRKPTPAKPEAAKTEAMKPEAVMQRVGEFMERNRDIQRKVSDATEEIRREQQKARQKEAEFGKPYDATRVADLERRLEQQRGYVARLEAELSAAKIESQEERSAKKAEAAAAAAKASKAFQEAMAPFNKERSALYRDAKPVSDAFATLVGTFVRKPEGLGVADTVVDANASDGFCSISWRDAEKKRVAWAHLRLRPLPARIPDQGKVAGKYPIQTVSKTNCWFWAGGVNVAFVVDSKDWQEKDKLPELAAKLLDLDALAALPKPKQAE